MADSVDWSGLLANLDPHGAIPGFYTVRLLAATTIRLATSICLASGTTVNRTVTPACGTGAFSTFSSMQHHGSKPSAKNGCIFGAGGSCRNGTARSTEFLPLSRRSTKPVHNGLPTMNVRVWSLGCTKCRLAPEFPWPAGVEDTGAAVRFVNDNIASYGGDSNRVFLMGHSAGAGHVAAYISHPEFHGPKGSGLAGAILSSGVSYEIKTQDASTVFPPAYFGADPSRYAERAALPGLVKTAIPFMMWSAELDPPVVAEQSVALKEAMCKSAHGCVRNLMLPHHSHMSEIFAIGTADTLHSDQIMEFIKDGKLATGYGTVPGKRHGGRW